MTKPEKVTKVHDAILEHTESIEPYAVYLPYLYVAMLREGSGYIDLDKSVEKDLEFLIFLETVFSENHYIWEFIEII
jgi:hypothetical protein